MGAEIVALMRSKDSPDPAMAMPGGPDKVLHARVCIRETTLLASDGHSQGVPKFEGFALSLTVSSPAEAEQRLAALGEGGQVRMP